jgi:hypothetical protein
VNRESPGFEKFALALGLTESAGNERAWGDPHNGGIWYRACGRWQMHPAFVWEFGPGQVGLDDSWDYVFQITLNNFYDARLRAGVSAYRMAMEFHLGVAAVKQGKTDTDYAERFNRHYLELPVGSA